jgi:uncharacterized SAM-binding protein YcdF (DUF218 family)
MEAGLEQPPPDAGSPRQEPPGQPWVLAVLGCVVRREAGGSGLRDGAARRRVFAAAEAWQRASRAPGDERAGQGRPSLVIASGGRAWDGWVEADAMAEALAELGVPEDRLVRERLSHTTRENARYVAAQCARRGIDRVAIVSCVWHLPRAVALFEAEGLYVIGQVPAGEMPAGWRSSWTRGRERLLLAMAGK